MVPNNSLEPCLNRSKRCLIAFSLECIRREYERYISGVICT
ncbi:unnamed protein product [Schistosoma margrebowiei]|uniref:Uncharacterized protein n=1 Tax=Schistosoma margrebowiei TaxID=48269 RepID=A0A183LSP4_9TREM|nr:unnamed protein product [Schistosoma margrebowiei]